MATTASVLKFGRKPATALSKSCSNYRQNVSDWTISTPIPDAIDYTFNVGYVTNNATPVFVATIPLNTNSSHQAISG
jgi:hypothetical protein